MIGASKEQDRIGPNSDQSADRRTVFVQGVSFAMNDTQFEQAFSEIGPVRKCFLINKKGHSTHQGSGIVQFSLPQDASRAIAEYNGKALMGREVQVTQATKRASLADRKERKREVLTIDTEDHNSKPPKKAKLDTSIGGWDRLKLLRTVVLGNLSTGCIPEAIRLARNQGKIDEIVKAVTDEDIAAANLRETGCTGEVIFVVYHTVKMAMASIKKLHGALLSGHEGHSKRKRAAEEEVAPHVRCLWARQLRGEGALVKKWRLILRNLPFNVKEEELKKLLSPAGFVWQVTVPVKDDGKSRGFAFASFTSRAHAEAAIKVVNGQKLRGRIVVADWAVPKATFQGSQVEAQPGDDVNASPTDQAAVEVDPSHVIETEGKVDVAVNGDRDAANDADTPEKEAAGTMSEKDLMRSMASFFADADENEEGGAKGEEVAKRTKIEKKPSDPVQSAEEEGDRKLRMARLQNQRTVFVRNLLSSISKQELQARLESFGLVKACRLVVNATTQQPKGTAFVEFADISGAQAAAEASRKGRCGEGPGVLLGGRALELDLALSQEEARAVAQGKAPTRQRDKRNLYLAKEGAIEEGSAAWRELSAGDQQRRAKAARDKALKLRSPNFLISTTRLSLRNLPYSLDHQTLKKILLQAVKDRASKAAPKLKQVKVLEETTKVDAEGNARGKGIAFAEFTEHEHALCALRQLNNNPNLFGKDRRPIVEFAVENAQALKMRDEREAGKKDWKERTTEKKATAERVPAERRDAKTQGAPVRKAKAPARGSRSQSGGGNPEAGPKGARVDGTRQARQQRSPAKQIASSLPTGNVRKSSLTKKEERALKQEVRKAAKQSQSAERKDTLDGLVAKYRSALFGEASGASSRRSSLKRWFE